jgi:hypothetical protein
MTDPAAPNLPTLEIAPFTEAATALAVPAPKPVADGATPAPETAVAQVAAATPAAPTVADRVKLAEEAAAKIVARRQATRRTESASSARVRQLESENAQLQQTTQQARAIAQQIEQDPLAVLRAKGVTDKTLAQAAIDDASPEGRIAKLERQNAALVAKLEADERARAASATTADVQTREHRFVSEVQSLRESAEPTAALLYPYLAARAKIAPHLVLAEAKAVIAQEMARQEREVPPHLRRVPTNRDVYDYQEWCLTQADAARLAATGAPPVVTTPAAATPPAVKPPPTRASAKLSNRDTGPAAAPKPYGKMTKEERLAHDAAMLRALTPAT